MDLELPDKLYFKIGEVSELIGVKPHVLRYWESEFSPVRPGKSRTQQRLYQRKDIELLLRVKDLLYRQGFTIAGAKKQLRAPVEESEQLDLLPPVSCDRELLLELRNDLLRLRKSLS
jgi:DNA-binding transcriptional MerR regulator